MNIKIFDFFYNGHGTPVNIGRREMMLGKANLQTASAKLKMYVFAEGETGVRVFPRKFK